LCVRRNAAGAIAANSYRLGAREHWRECRPGSTAAPPLLNIISCRAKQPSVLPPFCGGGRERLRACVRALASSSSSSHIGFLADRVRLTLSASSFAQFAGPPAVRITMLPLSDNPKSNGFNVYAARCPVTRGPKAEGARSREPIYPMMPRPPRSRTLLASR